MTSQRGTTTLALLGLLAGFVNVDAFRLTPAPCVGSSSASPRTQTAARRREASSAWRTAHRGLSMSTLSALDASATEEVDGKPSGASVMDELDAILGDMNTAVSRQFIGDAAFPGERGGRVVVLLGVRAGGRGMRCARFGCYQVGLTLPRSGGPMASAPPRASVSPSAFNLLSFDSALF